MRTRQRLENPNWRPIQQHLFGWASTIERILCGMPLPAMSGDTISIFSDYSGEHKASGYDVISVLCADLSSSARWEMGRRFLRRQYLSDGRRLSFKALNDRLRRRILVPFLQCADQIDGLCLTVAFQKTLQNLFVDEPSLNDTRQEFGLGSAWKLRPLERTLRVAHLIGLLLGGLSKRGQNVYWISDQDQLFANAEKSNDLRLMLQAFTTYYVRHPLGELGIGTTELDEGDRQLEDLAAVADFAAGTVCECVNVASQASGGRIPMGIAVELPTLSDKTDLLRRWLWSRAAALAKVAVVFEHAPDGMMGVFAFEARDFES